ncbi:hypothetical protein KNV99_01550 [Acinetobacter nosocomialis]|nr:hypothetical protein KNV99_01550 [Acinetobacter nosocomialis]
MCLVYQVKTSCFFSTHHTCELRNAGISIPKLREQNIEYAPALEHAAFELIQKFLKRIGYSA